jgi:hypothetical protein
MGIRVCVICDLCASRNPPSSHFKISLLVADVGQPCGWQIVEINRHRGVRNPRLPNHAVRFLVCPDCQTGPLWDTWRRWLDEDAAAVEAVEDEEEEEE